MEYDYDKDKELVRVEWLERLNGAIGYIEESLTGEFDVEEAARIACCSSYHFQRMFSYMAGLPLSEYVRRRRMTAAAFDLQRGDKVLDVALRYGYESPTAFNRAFQNIHGVSPSAARKEGSPLRAFPPLSFQIQIKGEAAMEYRIEKREAFRIIGKCKPLSKELDKNFKEVPEMWAESAMDGTVEKLVGHMDGEPKGVLGVSACMGEDWAYYVAVASNLPLPADIPGITEYTVPACTWAVFPGKGPMPNAITDIEKRAVTEWLPTSGYEYANAPDIELYLDANPANATFEVWIPVVSKKEQK